MAKDKSKKRKRNELHSQPSLEPDTSKPTAVYKPTVGRPYTVSVAIPTSIIANAQTHDAKTALAGTLARALAVFSADEAVLFSDGQAGRRSTSSSNGHAERDAASGYTAFADPPHFLAHLLTYLECPPHLRRALFPHHPNLRSAGALPSLDMPHHARAEEPLPFREGVATGAGREGWTMVDVGLREAVEVRGEVPVGARVTVRMLEAGKGEAVDPATPREEEGYYWGYGVRAAAGLSTVFTECPYEGGYDFCVGTSERGIPVSALLERARGEGDALPRWKHLLVAFGGVAGLEAAVKNDEALRTQGVKEPKELFDAWVNLVEGQQGSRTVRTEEAVWVGLSVLREIVVLNEG